MITANSRNVSRSEYALIRSSYRVSSRSLANNDSAFFRCVQLDSALRKRINHWYTGLGERPTSRLCVYDQASECVRLKGHSYLRFSASRSLTRFLA